MRSRRRIVHSRFGQWLAATVRELYRNDGSLQMRAAGYGYEYSSDLHKDFLTLTVLLL
jgi:hypothetical protein